MMHRGLVPWMVAALILAFAGPAAAYERPGLTERVSVAPDGTEGDDFSFVPTISADGRYVAFESNASTLVEGDTEAWDILVRDRKTGIIERASVASDGALPDDNSLKPAISGDGRAVAFESFASNLVPGDTNGDRDVFVHDLMAGTTERISVALDGAQANQASTDSAISADGRFVAFRSLASNLVPGDGNDASDIFVHDRETGTIERVSVTSDGDEGDGLSTVPAISADGRYVAFRSLASNLVPGDGNDASDIFVHDRETGTIERVSVTSDGDEGDGHSRFPAISADGRRVAFQSVASDLVPGDLNAESDIFVHDRQTGGTERVSVDSAGAEVVGDSRFASISADGRHVVFSSDASDLVAGDGNLASDIFVRDLAVGTTERVSLTADGGEGNAGSFFAAVTPDGGRISFSSDASNLVASDLNGAPDVFLRERGPALGVGALEAVATPGELLVSGWARFSGATAAVAEDPGDDGVPVGPVSADDLGAEVTGASVIHRPEAEDVLLRLRLGSLPGPAAGGSPGILYRWSFAAGGTAYEVRALRVGATAVPLGAPHFALFECAPECTEVARLTGGIGTTGTEVRVAVPLETLGVEPGAELSLIEVSTSLGEALPGELVPLDEATVPDAILPPHRVDLGLAPNGTAEPDVVYTAEADSAEGRFSARLNMSSLDHGDYRLWSRACLGNLCEARSIAVTP